MQKCEMQTLIACSLSGTRATVAIMEFKISSLRWIQLALLYVDAETQILDVLHKDGDVMPAHLFCLDTKSVVYW